MLSFMLFCCFTGASTYLDDHGPPAPRVSISLSVFSSFVSCFSPNLISVWCFPNRSLLFRQKRSAWKSWIQTKQSQFGCCSNALNQSLSNTLTHTHTHWLTAPTQKPCIHPAASLPCAFSPFLLPSSSLHPLYIMSFGQFCCNSSTISSPLSWKVLHSDSGAIIVCVVVMMLTENSPSLRIDNARLSWPDSATVDHMWD